MSRIKNIQKNLQDFFITNSFCRKVKIFFNGVFKTTILRIFLVFIVTLIFSFITIQIFKPKLITQLQIFATKYFYHILKLDKVEFAKINIIGNKRVASEDIISVIKNFKSDNFDNLTNKNSFEYFGSSMVIENLIDEIKIKNPWIDKIIIKRIMPDIVNIEVIEYHPFAIWLHEEKKYIIDRDGNTIPFLTEYENNPEFKNMVIVSGRGANKNIKSLFNILANNSAISQEIYSANWVGDRRWDIRFYDGLIVKLPESNIEKAWQDLIEIYEASKSKKLIKKIDLRVSGKIYIKYDNDNKIEQVKSINS